MNCCLSGAVVVSGFLWFLFFKFKSCSVLRQGPYWPDMHWEIFGNFVQAAYIKSFFIDSRNWYRQPARARTLFTVKSHTDHRETASVPLLIVPMSHSIVCTPMPSYEGGVDVHRVLELIWHNRP